MVDARRGRDNRSAGPVSLLDSSRLDVAYRLGGQRMCFGPGLPLACGLRGSEWAVCKALGLEPSDFLRLRAVCKRRGFVTSG